jgi:hypothetical protein
MQYTIAHDLETQIQSMMDNQDLVTEQQELMKAI